jgi:hypothetical protein
VRDGDHTRKRTSGLPRHIELRQKTSHKVSHFTVRSIEISEKRNGIHQTGIRLGILWDIRDRVYHSRMPKRNRVMCGSHRRYHRAIHPERLQSARALESASRRESRSVLLVLLVLLDRLHHVSVPAGGLRGLRGLDTDALLVGAGEGADGCLGLTLGDCEGRGRRR